MINITKVAGFLNAHEEVEGLDIDDVPFTNYPDMIKKINKELLEKLILILKEDNEAREHFLPLLLKVCTNHMQKAMTEEYVFLFYDELAGEMKAYLSQIDPTTYHNLSELYLSVIETNAEIRDHFFDSLDTLKEVTKFC